MGRHRLRRRDDRDSVGIDELPELVRGTVEFAFEGVERSAGRRLTRAKAAFVFHDIDNEIVQDIGYVVVSRCRIRVKSPELVRV